MNEYNRLKDKFNEDYDFDTLSEGTKEMFNNLSKQEKEIFEGLLEALTGVEKIPPYVAKMSIEGVRWTKDFHYEVTEAKWSAKDFMLEAIKMSAIIDEERIKQVK